MTSRFAPALVVALSALLALLLASPLVARAQEATVAKDDATALDSPPPPPGYAVISVSAYSYAPLAPYALATPTAPLTDDPSSASRVPRIVLELALGTGGLFGGGLLGFAIGAASCDDSGSADEWFPCLGEMVIGGGIGAGVGTPLAIWLGGRALDGNGGLGWTMLGSSAGFLAWAATIGALEGSDVAWAGLALPLIGGVLGFELSSDTSARAAEASASRTHFSASLTPKRGGAMLSLSGDF